jgi:NAD(P)-dependent dehydrogenase (short-subunit alcohol dehydrogenase family)
MTGQFHGKVALVTGGTLGIGRATAVAFARAGAQVVVCGRSDAAGAETVDLITSVGGAATFVRTDVSRAAEVEALIEATLATYGRLDCSCNNAGTSGAWAYTADLTEAQWEEALQINLQGVWLCMKYELPPMLRQGKGAIVNIASVAAVFGIEGRSAYCASKAG